MESTFSQIVLVVGGTMLCLMALLVWSQDAVSRATEALFESIECRMARRQKRRAEFADARVQLSFFEHAYQGRRAQQ